MKTIEQAAKEFTDVPMERVAYKVGIQYAQQWIPVEEELPKAEDNFYNLSAVTLVKCENLKNETTAYYDYDDKKWVSYLGNFVIKVTDWRPIELK